MLLTDKKLITKPLHVKGILAVIDFAFANRDFEYTIFRRFWRLENSFIAKKITKKGNFLE